MWTWTILYKVELMIHTLCIFKSPNIQLRAPHRLDHTPPNIFTILSATRTVLKGIHKSPTRTIEMVQDNRNEAIRILAS